MENGGGSRGGGWVGSLGALGVTAVLMGCGGGDGLGTDPPPGPAPQPREVSFEAHVQPIFTRSCAFAECHAGSTPQEHLSLSGGQTHGSAVGVPSNQVPRLFRIAPYDSDSSYVVLKLEGLAGSVGGVGTRMPLGGALTRAQIDTVRAWIAAGAPTN